MSEGMHMGEETRTGGESRRADARRHAHTTARERTRAGTRTRAGARTQKPEAVDEAINRAVNEIEGYLLWEAEKDRTRDRAQAFCDTLPWLTETQRQEVELRYRHDQHAASRAYLERIAARSTSLRAEYEDVYRALRRRLVTACVTAVSAVLLLATAMTLGLGGR
jgi:hypothetical protein